MIVKYHFSFKIYFVSDFYQLFLTLKWMVLKKKRSPKWTSQAFYMFLNLDAIITIVSYVLCVHDYTFITKTTYSFCGEEKK